MMLLSWAFGALGSVCPRQCPAVSGSVRFHDLVDTMSQDIVDTCSGGVHGSCPLCRWRCGDRGPVRAIR